MAALLLLESPAPSPFTPAAAGLLLALASLTKQEGVLVLLVAASLLAAARRFRDAAIVAGLGLGLGVLPWSLYRAAHGVTGLADFGLDAFQPAGPVRALAAFGDIALLPALPWIAGTALLFALTPGARRNHRPLFLGAGAYTGLILASFAFARPDVEWLVTWTWDRLALLPVAAVLPALFEAAAEPFEIREVQKG